MKTLRKALLRELHQLANEHHAGQIKESDYPTSNAPKPSKSTAVTHRWPRRRSVSRELILTEQEWLLKSERVCCSQIVISVEARFGIGRIHARNVPARCACAGQVLRTCGSGDHGGSRMLNLHLAEQDRPVLHCARLNDTQSGGHDWPQDEGRMSSWIVVNC